MLTRLVSPHARNKPTTAPGQTIYAIGDLHGRLDLLEIMVRSIESDIATRKPDCSRIVLLGDIIDRGPHSRELLERVWRIQTRSDRLIMLMGNHEDMLLASVDGSGNAQRLWLHNGGEATLRSYGLDPDVFSKSTPSLNTDTLVKAIGRNVLGWLRALPTSYRCGDYFFCHAGVRPGVPLRWQKPEDLLWVRKDFLKSKRWHGAVIVHGHSEVDDVDIQPNHVNLDTAAYRSGKLSAIGLQDTARWLLSAQR